MAHTREQLKDKLHQHRGEVVHERLWHVLSQSDAPFQIPSKLSNVYNYWGSFLVSIFKLQGGQLLGGVINLLQLYDGSFEQYVQGIFNDLLSRVALKFEFVELMHNICNMLQLQKNEIPKDWFGCILQYWS